MEFIRHCKLPILLVDDEPALLYSEKVILQAAGAAEVLTFDHSPDVLPFLAGREAGLVVLDLMMPGLTGEELLAEINAKRPGLPVIIVTAKDRAESAVRCMKGGAMDYIVKPFEEERFLLSVNKALEVRALREEGHTLRKYLLDDGLENPSAFAGIITADPKMKALFYYVEALSKSPQPVLITGETGVGKELIAGAVHKLAGGRGEFVAVNAAGLDDGMFSDTLFGHKKGAYTGAGEDRAGLIAQAAGGTLFLDEIGDLQPASQVKLLRLIQGGQYYPLGSDVAKKSDARIVVATNRDLGADSAVDKFRRDLYYRLSTHHIHIPPLRERPADILLLFEHFIEAAAEDMGRRTPDYPARVVKMLSEYAFPGNVRELQAMVYDAVARNQSGALPMQCFEEYIGSKSSGDADKAAHNADESADVLIGLFGKFPSLAEAELFLVEHALRLSHNNSDVAANLLGISRQSLKHKTGRKGD